MAEPQFRLVHEANVIHVDFLWSLHCFNPRPFRAIGIYRRVWEEADLDLLEDEPDMLPVARTPMPAPLWMKLPGGRFGTAYDGLTDTLPLMTYFDGQADPRASRSLKTGESSSVVVAFEEEDELTVEEDTASRLSGMNTTGYARASLTVSLLQRLLLSIFFVMARSEFQKGRALSIIVSHNGDKPFPHGDRRRVSLPGWLPVGVLKYSAILHTVRL